jgi:Tfp pilus assembly protein PilF
LLLRHLAVVCLLLVAASAQAAPSEPSHDPRVDATPCLEAGTAQDNDKAVTACGKVIDDEAATAADRLKAFRARAEAYARKDKLDLAIADYDAALKIELARPDLLNARGELWLRKGDKPRAIRDFSAAMKMDPSNEAARANYKALAQEIERMGAKMSVPPQSKSPAK